MTTFNMEKFSPKKAELTELANSYKNLVIKGIDDKEGYKIVDEARKNLKKKRVEITNTGKELRQEARDFADAVIKAQKELVAIIEPLEKDLKEKQDNIKEEQLKIDRAVLLPERKEKLAKINCTEKVDDDLLMMSPEDFNSYYNDKTAEYLEEEKRKLEEEKERLAQEEIDRKAKIAQEEADKIAEKKRLKDLEEARKQAKKDAEEKAEEDKKKAVEEERKRGEAEKQKIIDDQKRKELEAKHKKELEVQEAKHKEEKRIQVEEEKEKSKQVEKANMEKRKRFVEWLQENGYTEETKNEFHRIDTTTESILYKKISTFKI